MPQKFICPSILAADFSRLGEEVKTVLAAGADMVHFDVMDNHYVPNLSFGPLVCESLRKAGVKAPIDVHLMARPVDGLIRAFAAAGADYISIHPQATDHAHRSLTLIRESGCRSGLVLNPTTSLSAAERLWDEIDLLLLMSVNPGFGGQKFIPATLEKIRRARQLLDAGNRETRLAVDGGVNLGNLRGISEAGADTFVAGVAIFGSPDYAATIAQMRRLLEIA